MKRLLPLVPVIGLLAALSACRPGSGASGSPAVGFSSPVSYATGTYPMSVAVGDLNGDGVPDLVVGNDGGTVSVLLGNGDGTFHPAVPYAAGSKPDSVAVGDVNNDGAPDLIAANYGSNTVSVLLGYGDGTFPTTTPPTFPVGLEPMSVSVGDLNGDGNLDLVVANGGDNTVSVLLGNGNGTFAPARGSPISVGSSPYSVAIGDLNSDGIPDLAVANWNDNTVSVLLGNGNGTFAPARGSPISVSSPFWIAAGDFNGDGNLDLAVASHTVRGAVSVLLGNGDGTFKAAVGYVVRTGPDSVAVADFNGDGVPDLVTANSEDANASLLLGNGDGTFTAATVSPISTGTYPWSGSGPYAVATGDLNGDGKVDFVVANPVLNNVTVLLQR